MQCIYVYIITHFSGNNALIYIIGVLNLGNQLFDSDLNDKILGINFNEILNIKRRVGIAGSTYKSIPIYITFQKITDALISDIFTAKKLLDLIENKRF